MTDGKGALVLGANYRALGIARSLGRAGVETCVLSYPGDDQVARSSRFVRRSLNAPAGDDERQASGLLELAEDRNLGGWALFPTSDESAALIARQYRDLNAVYAMTSPRWDVFSHAYHKQGTHQIADRAGVAYPWTVYPKAREDVAALECPFPVILKPEVKKLPENEFTRAKAWRADDVESLLVAWDAATALVPADSVMVQELIPGTGEAQYSFAALCRGGEVLAWLTARRTRQYPRDFGHSSSLVETIHAPQSKPPGERSLKHSVGLGWSKLSSRMTAGTTR